ncbi:type II toxin-antitoxin system HicA family toxin [Patescibacteria group bacterium]|nr:MAG: type II toxin-antitoxin system HicA family toxin [Patescibacteria group bacterium]
MGTHCSERELIKKLKRLGFDGPESGGNHKLMNRDGKKVSLPHANGHHDIAVKLLFKILKEGGVTKEEWRGT